MFKRYWVSSSMFKRYWVSSSTIQRCWLFTTYVNCLHIGMPHTKLIKLLKILINLVNHKIFWYKLKKSIRHVLKNLPLLGNQHKSPGTAEFGTFIEIRIHARNYLKCRDFEKRSLIKNLFFSHVAVHLCVSNNAYVFALKELICGIK